MIFLPKTAAQKSGILETEPDQIYIIQPNQTKNVNGHLMLYSIVKP